MIWQNLNKADKTLLAAGAMFLFFLCLKAQYPDNVFAEGLLFCAEAALVGGIADWFAVTAIFEKPLGFPWHTAILPRRREAFIEATGKMLQQEFFSRKKLLTKVKKIDFARYAAEWLGDEAVKNQAVDKLLEYLKEFQQSHTEKLAISLKKSLDDQPVADMLMMAGENLPENPVASDGLRAIAYKLKEKAAGAEFREKIELALEEYKASKLQGGMAMMMAGMAQSMNLINIPEAAMLAQEEILKLLDNLCEDESEEKTVLLTALSENIIFFSKNDEFKQELSALWKNIVEVDTIQKSVSAISASAMNSNELRDVLTGLLTDWIENLLKDEKIHGKVNELFYDMAARSVLQAQTMLGEISRDVLSTLTDEQINKLVYDKVEPDLLWIRMNGSIVGAGIGAGLFLMLQLVK